MKQFSLLSAHGSSALSIWSISAERKAFLNLFGLNECPEMDSMKLVQVGKPVAFDEGILWLREAGQDCHAELHLHGGAGVASALRDYLSSFGFHEIAASQSGWGESEITSPLYARVLSAHFQPEKEGCLSEIAKLTSKEQKEWAMRSMKYAVWAELLERSPRIVLAGPANAGKSTLFNAWVAQERVTVSPHAGTTRDAVEAQILLGGGENAFEVILTDTAGLGSAMTPLEKQAELATHLALEGAWRVYWCFDATDPCLETIESITAHARPEDRILWLKARRGFSAPASKQLSMVGNVHLNPVELVRALTDDILHSIPPIPDDLALIPLGEARREKLKSLISS